MDKLLSQSGIIRILPLLLIIASVGIISFLLISSTAPSTGLFGLLNPKPASRAATIGSIGTSWTNVTNNLANMASECGNLGYMSAVPGSDMVIEIGRAHV